MRPSQITLGPCYTCTPMLRYVYKLTADVSTISGKAMLVVLTLFTAHMTAEQVI